MTIIGCDIGGVVKNQTDNTAIEQSIESLEELSQFNKIIFISKCKESYRAQSQEWLKSHGLDRLQAFYCLEYKEKVDIANREKVKVMIDDKIQVLKNFDADIHKIWFCNDSKKILGLKRYQPEIFESVSLATSWKDVIRLIK